MLYSKKFLYILSLLIIFFFNSKSYAISEEEYIKINNFIEVENVDEAFKLLKIIQKKKKRLSAKTLILIGKIYLALEKPAKSYEYFNKALFTSVSTDDLAYAGMSLSSIKLGNLNKAKDYAEKALKENPDIVDAKLALGLIYSDYGQLKKSDEFFKKAILASGNSLNAVRKYASSKMRIGKYNKAKQIINNALLEKKGDAATIDLLGKIFWVEGNVKEAIKLRTDASVMFRKNGNLLRAEQIMIWLNTTSSNQPKISQEKKISPKITTIKPRKNDFINKEELVNNLKPENININSKKEVLTGSGFILNKGKWVITNRHVIDGSTVISVRNGLGIVRSVKSIILPQNDKIDLAILKLKKSFPSKFSLSYQNISKPKTGEKIFVMGYPISSIIGRYNPSITEGIISKDTGFGEMPGQFQITATMNLGNSGGPIFNNKAQIVGISVGKLDKKLFLNKEGFIPQDVNIGISGGVLKSFLNTKVLKSSKSLIKEYNASEIYQFMRPSVVFVVGQ